MKARLAISFGYNSLVVMIIMEMKEYNDIYSFAQHTQLFQ